MENLEAEYTASRARVLADAPGPRVAVGRRPEPPIETAPHTSRRKPEFEPIHCRAERADGRPCQALPVFPSRFCMPHDPAYAEQRHENAVAGGRASGVARRGGPLSSVELDFSERVGIQAAIETIVALELTGRISPARSRNVLRALSIARANFDRSNNRRLDHDRARMATARAGLQRNLAQALDEAREADTPPPRPLPQPKYVSPSRIPPSFYEAIDKLLG